MFSFVIKIAIDVIRAEMLAIGIPILGLTIDNVKDTIVDKDPTKFSESIRIIFFLQGFILSSILFIISFK